ncbi:MAG: type 4a pilus biogenesis protein PilO [Candidatus Omnitrophota bacterium]
MTPVADEVKAFLAKINIRDEKSQILAVGGAVTALVLVLYFLLLFGPSMARLGVLGGESRDLIDGITKTENELSRKELIEKRLADAKSIYDAEKESLSSDKEVPILLSELSNIARETGVKIIKIDPIESRGRGGRPDAEKDEKKPYKTVSIVVDAQCGYHQLGLMLNRLENSARFIDVSEMSIRTNNRDARSHNVRLVINAYISVE